MNNHFIRMPEGVIVEETTTTYGRFVLQPLERGYGVTIGNSLRRILMSSLSGTAITAIRIDGVQHEFSTIAGVSEDVADMILNLKGVRFRTRDLSDGDITLTVRGPGVFTAADIAMATNDYDILNPSHHVATLADGAEIRIELRMGYGRGYVPAEENKMSDDPIGVIAIDSIFTPIVNVKYQITPARVGQRIDFERLVMEITTDGSITPDDALSQSAQIMRDHLALMSNMDAEPMLREEVKEVDAEVQRIRELLSQTVDELDLSVRAHNCLKAANIKNIGDLVRREESEMLKFRNFGRKSLQELIEVLQDRGLYFGMDVDKYMQES
jgi:DNA-directed RNA polymerase subunit alpha